MNVRRKNLNIFDVYNKRNIHNVSEAWGFLVVLAVLLLSCATKHNLSENLPKTVGNTDLLHSSNAFIAERAWKDLQILTSFGSRPTGSYSNEILAIDFLTREISYIKQMAHKKQHIELDKQVASGAFWADFKPNGMTSVYRNVQNVVVKLHGEPQNANHTLLVNCHFDSVAGSPGASDDASSCVVMLEMLRVFSRRHERNRYPVVFLFNGAEETGLQAAHGFITQHKWAPHIKAFINLESVGSAGKELLFQSSPLNSWLIKLYGKSAPHPNAQVAAEEVFQSGLIPSNTDFKIFHTFGGLPGLDFAHTVNGYRYHTKFDHIHYLSKSVLQHTGDNILELTKLVANSEELGKKINTNPLSSGPQVFYDILGLMFVSYSTEFATMLNYTIVSCAVLIPYLILSKATRGINKKHLRYEIFLGFLINMISLVTSNALCYAIAYDLDSMGKSMTWYSNTLICVPTYCLATVFVQCVAHLIFNRSLNAPLSLALKTQSRLIGTCFFWSILAAALTGANIRSAYVIVLPLLISLGSNIVNGICGFQNSIRRWLYVHLVAQCLVVLWTTHFYHLVVDMFIPTAGRSGGNKNPDVMIAIICSTLTFFTTSYLTPLVILFKKSKNFLISLFTIYIVTRFYFIAFTRYGFPYTDDSSGSPKVQRHYITHSIRTLYDREGNIRYTDSGFWMLEMDRNARKTIESLTMPEEPIPQTENILCKNEVFCGLPMYSSRQLITSGYWVPGPAPLLRESAHVNLISHEKPTKLIHRLTFRLTGSYLVSFQIRLKEAVSLQKWSLTPKVPPETTYNKQASYFVMITHGLESESMNITLDLKTIVAEHKRSLLDITLVTYHWEYHKDHTSVFANMLSKLPKWAYAVPAVASLKSWTF